MSLVLTLAIRTVDQRVVSPLLCGSHPYPYGSLTYRFSILTILLFARIVNKEITDLKFFLQTCAKTDYLGKTAPIRLQISTTISFGAAAFSRAWLFPS